MFHKLYNDGNILFKAIFEIKMSVSLKHNLQVYNLITFENNQTDPKSKVLQPH